MRRREVIALFGGAAAALLRPVAARAQQNGGLRRVGVLIGTAESDLESKRRVDALVGGLHDAGWIVGRNIRLDYRFSSADPDRMRRYAMEIVDLKPDVIVVHSNDFLAALLQAGRSIPTVFAQVGDPVGSGFVESLAHPGGNLTGFTTFESEIGGKWLQTLKEFAPSMTRALVLFDEKIVANRRYFHAAEAAASALGMTVTAAALQDPSEFENAIGSFGEGPTAGLVVLPSPLTGVNREQIIALAAKHRMPAIYAFRFFAASGGLLSYGVDTGDLYRRAASYVDRILNGAKPAELPVQQPTKFELVINLKTAKALGLDIPSALLTRADEVIE
jgi:putative tryptophan/tyrosine transport system substrate-binding protein